MGRYVCFPQIRDNGTIILKYGFEIGDIRHYLSWVKGYPIGLSWEISGRPLNLIFLVFWFPHQIWDHFRKGIEYARQEKEGKARAQQSLFGQAAQSRSRGGEQTESQRAKAEKGKVSDVQYPILKDPPKGYGPKFKKPTQLDLQFTKRIPEELKTGDVPPSQRARMVTTGNILAAGNIVQNESDAAALLSHIRKSTFLRVAVFDSL